MHHPSPYTQISKVANTKTQTQHPKSIWGVYSKATSTGRQGPGDVRMIKFDGRGRAG